MARVLAQQLPVTNHCTEFFTVVLSVLPVGFWQPARQDSLMPLSFESQNFPRIHHEQNALGPEGRFISEPGKEGDVGERLPRCLPRLP